MKEEYFIKIGKLYLEYLDVNEYRPEYLFISEIRFTCEKNEAIAFSEERVFNLKEILINVLKIKSEEILIISVKEDTDKKTEMEF